MLRADFRLVETYVCADADCADPLEVPVAAVGARGDNRYLPEQLSQWAAHCRAPGEGRYTTPSITPSLFSFLLASCDSA